MQRDDFEVRPFPSIDTVGLTSDPHPIRVCIVTEEIIGPVRNGGIASTYYHLSKGLAAHGHEVHVLFLKGPVVQDKTPQHWVDHFAEFGVTLHYLDVPHGTRWGAATEWQDRFMAAYVWLRDQAPFDVVHTSEWRGGLIYALMAKRMGIAFRETLFLVKTSSPHIWNRHYQMQPIDKRDLVAASYAEQKCVELADMVIGGSAHLITFMERIGYRLPPANVFVQPNIVDFSNVPVQDMRGAREPGDIVRTRDIVFFGRLEGRKGVELFCNALDILRERGVAPDSVTFLGKWGAPLATQGGMQVEDYIRLKSAAWECPVEIVTDRNQPEALSLMCARDTIAVMPSLIENSTMAVYETLEKRIPFIATAVGGTPELIDPADHAACLVAPRAQDLADRLEAALRDGQPIARPSFSNAANLEVWYGFHNHIGARMAAEGRAHAVAALTAPVEPVAQPVRTIAWVALIRRGDHPADLAAALAADAPDEVVLAFTEAALRPDVGAAVATLMEAGIAARALDCIGAAAGEALDRAAAAPDTDALVLCDGASVRPRPGCLAALRTALTHRPDDFVTAFAEDHDGTLAMPLGGDAASQYLGARAYGAECVAMRRERHAALGPLEPYDVQNGLIHEYVTRNVARGADLLVIPETHFDWPTLMQTSRIHREDGLHGYLRAKPMIDAASLPLRKILLAGLSDQASGGSVNEAALRDGSRSKDDPVWLMPVEWNRDDIGEAGRHRLAVALDETENRLWLMARGPGTRTFMVSNTPQKVTEVPQDAAGDLAEEMTVAHFDIPATWEVGSAVPIRWELDESAGDLRTRFLRISRLGANTYALSARRPVLSKAAFDRLLARHRSATDFASALDFSDLTGDVEDFDGLSPETAQLFASAGVSTRREGGRVRLARPVGGVEAASVDDLLALAYDTGRAGLERRMAMERSEALLADLPATDPAVAGDLRSGVILPEGGLWKKGGWVEGWVWDRAAPDRSFTVVLARDGSDVVAVEAATRIDRLGRRTPGLERHGFRLPLPPALFSDDGSGSPVDLRVAETGALLRGGRLAPMPDGTFGPASDTVEDAAGALAQSDGILGALGADPAAWRVRDGAEVRAGVMSPGDAFRPEGSWIEGWAWDRATPETTLHVAVFQDEKPVFAAMAGLLIPSLGNRTPGLEVHGFRLPVLSRLTAAPIEIRVIETGTPVRNGRFVPAVGTGKRPGLAPADRT